MTSTLNIHQNVSLAQFTTLRVGGPAAYFVEAVDRSQLRHAVEFARDEALPVFVLGGGSNVVIAKSGFQGLVIKVGMRGINEVENADGTVSVSVGAGEEWDSFVEHCVRRNYAGVECLSGIPGLVGGTPIQNVGAYGQDVSQTIVSVECLDRLTFDSFTLDAADCGFAYRKSVFNSSHRDRFVVTSVTFRLGIGAKPELRYRELQEKFRGREPTLYEIREAVLAIRTSKSMVIDPADPNSRSVGSFFKNPVVSAAEYLRLKNIHASIPSFTAENAVKLSAAWLIENAGFEKGFVMGNAGISANHALALIALGSATADDLLALKDLIQRRVSERFGIHLEPEPVMVGFNS